MATLHQRTTARRIAAALLLAGATLVGFTALPAGAQHPELSAVAACVDGHQWAVQWTASSFDTDPANVAADHGHVVVEYRVGDQAFTQVPTGSPGAFTPDARRFSGSVPVLEPLPTTVEVQMHTVGPWGNGAGGGEARHVSLVVDGDCAGAQPAAALAWSCDAGLTVSSTNGGASGALVTITQDGQHLGQVHVAAGQPWLATALGDPLGEGQTAHFAASFGPHELAASGPVTKACEPPPAPEPEPEPALEPDPELDLTEPPPDEPSLSEDEASGEPADLPGTEELTAVETAEEAELDVEVTADDVGVVDPTVESAALPDVIEEVAPSEVPAAEVASGGATRAAQDDDQAARISFDCASGVTVSLINDGAESVAFQVFLGGSVVEVTDVAGGATDIRNFELASGATATYEVRSGGRTLAGPQTITADCEEPRAPAAGAPQTSATAGSQLADTGAESMALVTFAGVLLMLGGASILASQRREDLLITVPVAR